MKREDVESVVKSTSKNHALTRGGSFYLAGFVDAFTTVYPEKRWKKVLQEKFFLPDQSHFGDKAFYQSASELTVANHILREHVRDFAVDKQVNAKSKKDVDVAYRVRSTHVAVEVKCPDESATVLPVITSGTQPILSLITAGRVPDHVQQLGDLKQKIESAGAATVVLGKNRDLALKDCLISASGKFSADSSVDNLNILFVAAGYVGKMSEWYMNLFAPQGLFTSEPLHPPEEFKLVDLVILSNLRYWHEHAPAHHDWTLQRVLLIPFTNPHRRSSCMTDACSEGLSVFPHFFDRFNAFDDPAKDDVPDYVLEPLRLLHFINQGLTEEELDRYFPIRLYPLGKAAIEAAKK